MPTQTKYASTTFTDGWTNTSNMYADDGVYAETAPAQSSVNETKVSGFGFTIPDDATITNITAEVEWHVSTQSSIATLQFHKHFNGSDIGNTYSNSSEPLSDIVGSSSKDDPSLTPAQANTDGASGLSIFIRGSRGNSAIAVTFYIDFVRVTITYTQPIVVLVLSDSLSFTDSIQKVSNKVIQSLYTLFERFCYTDSVFGGATEHIDLADRRSSVLYKRLLDTFGLTDEFQRLKLVPLVLASIIALYDNVTKGVTKQLDDYIEFYDYNNIKVSKNILDNFNFTDLFIANKQAVLGIIERINVGDRIQGLVNKRLLDSLNLNDSTVLYLQQEHTSTLYLFNRLDLIDSVAKHIILVKNDNIGLTAELSNTGYLSLQDTISFTDKIAMRVIKVLGEIIPLTDDITQLLESIPFYFDENSVSPEDIITDVSIYG